MNRKISILIILVITTIILISFFSSYKELTRDKELFNISILEIEKNTIQEYKNILKDSINTTMIMIESTYNRIIKNNTKLMTIELNTILNDIKNNKINIYKYIKNYKHDFFTLTLEKTNNKINKNVRINDIKFYISMKDKRVDKIFEDAVRNFLYENITKDNRYTWINKIINFDGGDNYAIRLIHPNLKNTEGMLLSTNMQDIKGNKPFLKELNGIKENQELYFRYYFKIINSKNISEKLSYAKLYKNKNWIIATGIPLTNLKEKINQRKIDIERSFENHIYETIISQLPTFILFILALLFLRNKLLQYFNETKRLEEQLSKKLDFTEKQADSFFNLSINLQVISDYNGNIIQINNSSKYLLGYSPKELTNTCFLDLVHPDDFDITVKEMNKLKEGKVVYYFENRYKHKDGHYITLAWSANSNEDRTLIYASANDKSILKAKEQMLLQQSKMASMGEMIENIAHQWRQPLSIISTLSSGVKLKNDLLMLEKNEIKEAMEDINFSVQHLSQTIDDFKSFFKSDKIRKAFRISDCLEKSLKLTSSQFKSENIRIIKDIEDITFYGLENELIQVFINIINNARDELVIKENVNKLIIIDIKKVKNILTILIKDNAGGIPKEILLKIFKSHFTTKENTKGTGIGLYMSKLIIEENMNGTIIVQNVDFTYDNINYYGAEFNISLPLNMKEKK